MRQHARVANRIIMQAQDAEVVHAQPLGADQQARHRGALAVMQQQPIAQRQVSDFKRSAFDELR